MAAAVSVEKCNCAKLGARGNSRLTGTVMFTLSTHAVNKLMFYDINVGDLY